jgi:hypothetical protein
MKSNNTRMLSAQNMRRTVVKMEQKPADLMSQVKVQVAKLTPAQRDYILTPCLEAVAALQIGTFTTEHFRSLVDAFNVGELLAKPPYNLCNDHAHKFGAVLLALEVLATRYSFTQTWVPGERRMQVVKDAMEIHEIQLQFVSQAEFFDALTRVAIKARNALAGHAVGRTVLEVA